MVIVNPAMVLGSRDFRLTPSMRYARDLLRGIIITIPSGLNVVSVQDVAAAHIAAADRGRAGERYIIGGENLSGKAMKPAGSTGLQGAAGSYVVSSLGLDAHRNRGGVPE